MGPLHPGIGRSPVGGDAIPSGDKMGWSVLKDDWYSTPLDSCENGGYL